MTPFDRVERPFGTRIATNPAAFHRAPLAAVVGCDRSLRRCGLPGRAATAPFRRPMRIVQAILRRFLTTALVLTLSACVGPRVLTEADAPPTGAPLGWASTGRSALRAGATVPASRAPDAMREPAGPPALAERFEDLVPDEGEIDDGAETFAPPKPTAPPRTTCMAPLDDTEPLYVLPYAVGDSYLVRQGTCGPVTHKGAFSYSYDFDMEPGTPILAARGGVVVSVVEQHPENTNRSRHANYVVIRHEDGQHSRYMHLQTDGVTVAEGDTVSAGDLIAYSGNSGRSSKPHLHFDVTNGCGRVSSRCPTLPVTFRNADDPAPAGGRSYEARSF